MEYLLLFFIIAGFIAGFLKPAPKPYSVSYSMPVKSGSNVNENQKEAITVLKDLGFSATEAKKHVASAGGSSTEEIVRNALSSMEI